MSLKTLLVPNNNKKNLNLYCNTINLQDPIIMGVFTEAERDAYPGPVEGSVIFNTTTDKLSLYDGSSWSDVGGAVVVAHNSTTGLQGGTTNEYYHLTQQQHSDLTNQSTQLKSTGSPTFVNMTGTLQTASQPNITSLGILTQCNADNLRLDGNTISSTNTNGNIDIDCNGTGKVRVLNDTFEVGASFSVTTTGVTASNRLTITNSSIEGLILNCNNQNIAKLGRVGSSGLRLEMTTAGGSIFKSRDQATYTSARPITLDGSKYVINSLTTSPTISGDLFIDSSGEVLQKPYTSVITSETIKDSATDPSVSIGTTYLKASTTTGDYAIGLANGTETQIKTIIMGLHDGGDDYVMTPTATIGFNTITFSDVGQSVILQYYNDTDSLIGWAIIGSNGVTIG